MSAMPMKRALFCLFVAAGLVAAGPSVRAQEAIPGDQPAAFEADEMTHDKELGIVTARGDVEVNHAGRTLLADTISYNQDTDTIHARGGVTLHRPNGDVLFAESMEVTGDLKNGVIENFRAVLSDRSRFAAGRAELVNDETLTMDRAVYSACEPCQSDPSRPLLWQLKAVKIVQDKVNKVVEYENAWLEFAGVPVAYTPYFSHPDPTVKRKSGFLAPSVGSSTDLGLIAQVPYFYVIDDYSDVTLTPIVTTQENGGLAGQYRERFTKGELNTEASAVYDSNETLMGHIDADARFDMTRTWRMGGKINRTSDDTYMRRYGFGSASTLTSNLYAEGFRGDNYARVEGFAFQGLSANDDPKTTPLVLPVARYNHQGAPGRYGDYETLDMNVAVLSREQGVDSERISIRPGWHLPYTAPMGDRYELSASLGMDFFHASGVDAPNAYADVTNGEYDGAALRVTPEVAFKWSWPLARRHGSVTEVIEPIGQVIVSPYGGNSYKMPNEDSQDFDFNDTNLFSTNRFTGYDRVESGPRANYGLKWGVYGDGGGSTTVMVGQSYRAKADDTFEQGSGLADNQSDYVAKVTVSPGKHLDLLYRTRIDHDTLDFNRNEMGAQGVYGPFNYNLDYIYFSRQGDDTEFDGRRELSAGLTTQLTDFWSTRISGVRDLSENGGPRNMRLGFTYEDECFQFDTQMSRTFYTDREIKPNDTIMFRLVFKTLGAVDTGALSAL